MLFSPNSSPTREGSSNSSALARFWELILFFGYLIFLSLWVLPGLRWGYDLGHHSVLLMTSLRIWQGQVPFQDFYPLYGPLFDYFLALGVRLLGNNLFALKLFLNYLSPALCILLLMFALRKFRLSVPTRFFIYTATISFGLERLIASPRAFLPILILALWMTGFNLRNRGTDLLIFPGIILCFFFSPETGIYLFPAGLVLIALKLYFLNSGRDRLKFLLRSLSGMLVSAVFLALLFTSTSWFRNYLVFVSGVSQNFRWMAGLPLPDLAAIRANPWDLFYYLPPLIYAFALGRILLSWFRRQSEPEILILTAGLIVFGAMLWHSATERTSVWHLKFSFLPALILVGMAFPKNLRPLQVKKIFSLAGLLLFLILGTIFFNPAPPPSFKDKTYAEVMGVRVSLRERKIFDRIQEFANSHNPEEIVFPFKSLYYGFLGHPPNLPLDALDVLSAPVDIDAYLKAVKDLDARYIIINQDDLFWSFVGELVDGLMDYIDENYQPILIEESLRIYEKREAPLPLSQIIAQDSGPILLNPENNFSVQLSVPPEMNQSPGYLEFQAEFKYSSPLKRIFSLPMVECFFDGRKWKFYRPGMGRQRINNSGESHPYRLYLLYPAKVLTIQVDFPGALNFQPKKIILRHLQWHLKTAPVTPRLVFYQLESEPE